MPSNDTLLLRLLLLLLRLLLLRYYCYYSSPCSTACHQPTRSPPLAKSRITTHTRIDIRLIYADIQQYADAPRPMLALSHARIYTPHLIERGGVVWQGEVVAKFLAP